jgi:hypothetical protein
VWPLESALARAVCFALATALPVPWYARLPFTVLTSLWRCGRSSCSMT